MAREGKALEATSLRLADWAGEESLETRNGERPRTAVVVDEDASWIEAVEQLLGRLGIAMVGATESPDSALDLVVEREPDVLIVGVNEGVAEDASRACLRAARERFPSLTTIGLASSNAVAPLEVPDTVEWENDVSLDEADLNELPEQ
jgi:CheY-like chemotaxis protein